MLTAVNFKKLLLDDKTIEELMFWERSVFDTALARCTGRVVLFGAGKLGRNTLAVLRENGIEPIAFCDSGKEKWGKKIDGLPVFSPIEAGKEFGKDSLFIITVFNLLKSNNTFLHRTLRQYGCKKVLYYATLFWKYGNVCFADSVAVDWILKPSEIANQIERIEAAYKLLDDESKGIFVAILKSRIFTDSDWNILHTKAQPHFCELFRSSETEKFIDCGAFDGDTLRDFLQFCNGEFSRYFAFEPIPDNLHELSEWIKVLNQKTRDKIEVWPYAVGNVNINLSFDYAEKSSHAVDQGSIEVECVKLDDVLKDKEVSWLKMDIEGAEKEALDGARRLIGKYMPKLSICVYHKSDDLWNIPLLINDICKGYNFFLRVHETGDAICYASR